MNVTIRTVSLMMLASSVACHISANAEVIEGFTQPTETVHVAAPESGIIDELNLKQGASVTAGQVIAILDNRVLDATLEAARAKADAKGSVLAAQAVLRQRQSRRDHMLHLRDNGHASPEELDRAESELEIAKANVVTAQEETKANSLELKRIEAQIERRIIRSPIDGVLTQLPKRRGEFVTATDSSIATVVNIDDLRAIFHVPTADAVGLQTSQTMKVQFAADNRLAEARIDFVSPITDAESNLVRVEVIIDNIKRQYRSGVRCYLKIGSADRLYSAARGPNVPTPKNFSR